VLLLALEADRGRVGLQPSNAAEPLSVKTWLALAGLVCDEGGFKEERMPL
jgi:hypothetical protein